MTEFNGSIATAFALYLAVMLGIGIHAYRRTADLSDYILGGRRLNALVAALSAGASDMSGWLLLGLPGYAHASGFEAFWIAIGLLAGTWINWSLVATRLRRITQTAGNALTLPDYFERRFADSSRTLRIVTALFILVFFLFYTSAGLVAGGKLFNTVFGLPYEWAVLTGALTIIGYTFLGGFLAVSWTDAVQALLMLFALTAVPIMALGELGGTDAALQAMGTVNQALLDAFSDKGGEPLGVIAILSLLGWGLGYFGQPHILARFMAIRSTDEIPRARLIAVAWSALTMAGALLVGFTSVGLLQPPLAGGDPEKVFILLVQTLFHPLVAGICLAAILAAIMSTADSQLLVSSSALAEDFYKGLLRPHAPQRELVWVGRAGVVVIALLATLLALKPDNQVLELVAYAWAGFGAAFGPAILVSLFWPGMTRNGALAGILTGGITVIAWKQGTGGWFDLYEIIPGFLFALVAILVVSHVEGVLARGRE
jgi:sodium/proline symporter